jgi:hypothetical protein
MSTSLEEPADKYVTGMPEKKLNPDTGNDNEALTIIFLRGKYK